VSPHASEAHRVTHLETDLRELRRELGLLLNRVRNAIALAGEAVIEGSRKKAERVIAGDAEIDAKQRVLETQCLELISKHQLVARDARLVTGVLGSLSDLERVGDYAVHIAEDAHGVRLEGMFETFHAIFQMLRDMSERLGEALMRDDAALARGVRDQDADVDALVDAASGHIMATRSTLGVAADHLLEVLATLRVLRAAQRIGDHLENVAERLEFWVTGTRSS
jgi:phosphate transport system protein